jgi:SP family sugar:H+ symporter-like MFS transporter
MTAAAVPVQPASRINTGYVVLIAASAAIGGFLFGFDSAVINGAVPGIQASFQSAGAGTGFAVASILLGSAVGALSAGPLADRVGRPRALLFTGVLFAITAVLTTIAPTEILFTAIRFVSGIAVGGASVVAPAYIAEVSPAPMRGRLTSLQQLGIVVGIFIAFLVDYVITQAAGGVNEPFWFGLDAWRCMFLTETIPALVLVVAALVIPESPRWLVANKRNDEALTVLRKIEPDTQESAVADIQRTVESSRKPSMRDLFDTKTGRIFAIVWIGIALAALQQFVGINVIFYYGTTLWEAVGFSSSDSLQINLISGGINIVATLVAISIVDRVGRKPMLFGGSIALAITLIILVLMFSTGTTDAEGNLVLPKPQSLIALIAANAYVFAFGVSWGPVVWVMLGEMFNNRIRGAALAVAVTAQWLANWLVTVSFPPILDQLGPGVAYGIYAVFAVIAIVFVRRYLTETKGRTLEQM